MNVPKILTLLFSIFFRIVAFKSTLLFINNSAHACSKFHANSRHALSSVSIYLAIFKNIKYDFSLFHHFQDIIAAIIFDQARESSTALATL
ncbi:MAG: hypothetical protein Q8S84_05145 [bacterium]|nr:hypothetical protein [bacterium]MDP3380879.1 hypothetical protein [bacterium]